MFPEYHGSPEHHHLVEQHSLPDLTFSWSTVSRTPLSSGHHRAWSTFVIWTAASLEHHGLLITTISWSSIALHASISRSTTVY